MKISSSLLLAGLAGMPMALLGQVTVNATASATLMPHLTLNEASQMQFGGFIAAPAGGDIQLDHDSTVNYPAGTVAAGAAPAAARFTVTGAPLSNYDLTIPAQFNITRVGGAETMQVAITEVKFASDPGLYVIAGLWGTVPNAGTDDLYFRSSLTVGPNQVIGNYVGNYNVTVNYQ